MNLQKICIIGDGLAGLSTALILSQENIKIDLYASNNNKLLKKDDRTTAISDSSYRFIKQQLNSKNKNIFWPSKIIELFYEDKKKINNFLNFKDENKNLMYIFKNKELKKELEKKLKKILQILIIQMEVYC